MRLSIALLLLLALTGCETVPVGDPTELDGPMFGGKKDTNFYMMPETGTLRLRDVATVARVIRKYKTLAAAEKELLRRSAQMQFNGLITLEIQRLEPKYEPIKRAARRNLSADAARKKVAEIESAQQKEALRNIAARMGESIALPVSTGENKSLMAFASVGNGRVEVADALYEIDVPIAKLPAKSTISGPKGEVATLLMDNAINLPTSPSKP